MREYHKTHQSKKMNTSQGNTKKTSCQCQARIWGLANKDGLFATGQIQCTKTADKDGLCKIHHNAEKDRKGKVWSYCNPNEEYKSNKRWWGRITQNIEDYTIDIDFKIDGKPVVVSRWRGENGELIAPFIIEKVHKGEWIFNPLGYKKHLARMNADKKVKKKIISRSKIHIDEVEHKEDETYETLYHSDYIDGILVKTYSMEVYINDGHDEIEEDNFIGYWENGVGIVSPEYYD